MAEDQPPVGRRPRAARARRRPARARRRRRSVFGEACQARVPSPRAALSGSAPSCATVAASSSARQASTPLRAGSPSGASVAAQRSTLPRIQVASGQLAQARHRLGRPAAEHGVVARRAGSGRRRAARASSSTASSAGRLPWMSKSSASIALHGPTLTLRLPVARRRARAARRSPATPRSRAGSRGARTPRSTSRWPTSTASRRSATAASSSTCSSSTASTGRPASPASTSSRRATCAAWSAPGSAGAFWGTGANRESKALVAHLAFAVLGMHRLGSYSNPANVRSTKALLGVGFTHEGVLRHWHRHGDALLRRQRLRDAALRLGGRARWPSVPVTVEGHVPAAFVARRRARSPAPRRRPPLSCR